jgi:endoribonuclease LACTB2
MNIVDVGYDSTHYYVLAGKKPLLLIDVGFPGTLPKLQHACNRMKIRVADIPHLLCTHYHPDHAGLAGELQRVGMSLLVLDVQVEASATLKTLMKPEYHYIDIDLKNSSIFRIEDSRAFLANIGIAGEIVHTPGHSDDSVTLVLDRGEAFTGDLTHPQISDDATIQQSWQKIHALKTTRIMPGHGPVWTLNSK